MLDQLHQTFADRGCVHVPGLLPTDVVGPAYARVRSVLDRCKPDEPSNATRKRLKPLSKLPEFSALLTHELRAHAVELAGGQELDEPLDRPQILYTPPDADQWTVPHTIWHLDVPRLGEIGLVGVQMFAFLDRVEPGGGGTVVVAGSHRLLNDQGKIRSKDVKKKLAREPYFKDLMNGALPNRDRLTQEIGRVGDVELQVFELCGEPGDVFFSDLRILHSLAPNARATPRLMVTHRFFVKEVARFLYEGDS